MENSLLFIFGEIWPKSLYYSTGTLARFWSNFKNSRCNRNQLKLATQHKNIIKIKNSHLVIFGKIWPGLIFSRFSCTCITLAIFISLVRKLHRPFFKFEDLSHNYRPVIYEPSHWPVVNEDCPPEASPFDPPRPPPPLLSAPDNSKRTNHQKEANTPAGNDRRLGYCEPCGVRFEDMEKVSTV